VARDDSLSLRRATIGDSEPLARGVIEGVEDYPSFAPPGWTPPRFEAELNHLRAALADPDVCCLGFCELHDPLLPHASVA